MFVAGVSTDPTPDPSEVSEWAWVDVHHLHAVAEMAPALLSPWSVLQLRALSARDERLSR